MDTLVNLSPIALGVIIFGIVLLMALIRNIESKRLYNKYPGDQIILASFGVTWFGQESLISKPLRKIGAVALVKEGIYYHSRFGDSEVYIPADKIKTIGTTDYFCDKALHDTVIQISFKTDENKLDRIAFRIPAPAKWLAILQKHLLN